jgi:type IV secretory pathway VirB10-like protein
MYENKIIVLIIVIAILIIGVIAYIILRKPDESSESPKLKSAGAPPPAETPSAPGNEPAATPASAPKPQARMDKSNLVNLLAKSKNAGSKPAQPESTQSQSETPDQAPAEENKESDSGAKTEDEIMQLMEDEPADDTNAVDASANQSETSSQEQPADCDASDNTIGDSQDTSVAKSQSVFCTAMLPMGRQCRNKASNGGKCQRHQGGN